MSDFMGQEGFVWFVGVVEDRDDPERLGRVRVRCLGYHTENKTLIETEDLPWANVMGPTDTPSMNGLGHTPPFIVEGSWVLGFFRDVEQQQPIILGTLPGFNTEEIAKILAGTLQESDGFKEISSDLEKKNIPIEGKITLVPKNVIKVSDEMGDKIEKSGSDLEAINSSFNALLSNTTSGLITKT